MKCTIKVLFILLFCFAMFGCATFQGVVSEKTLIQSAAVDTSISQLQTQQAGSATAVEQVSATASAIETTAAGINNGKLSEQTATLKTQVNNLSGSLEKERNKTAEIEKNYSDLKVTSGTELINSSKQVNKLTAQIKLARKWIWILSGILALAAAVRVALIILKIKYNISIPYFINLLI